MEKPIDCKNLVPPLVRVPRWHCRIGSWFEGDCPIYLGKGGCKFQEKQMKDQHAPPKPKTFEVYCLKWTATQIISPNGGNYTSKERAEKHCKICNDALPFWRRFFVHKWVVSTLTIKE